MTLNNENTALTKAGRVVDIHTHVYVPTYLQLLRERHQVPRILPPLDPDNEASLERLVILPGEDKDVTTANGRPVTTGFSDVEEKLQFMDTHGIDTSVISLANPWLDFLPDTESTYKTAHDINDEIAHMCCQAPKGRLYSFGVLPLVNIQASIKEIQYISGLDSMRGVIMGTHGCEGRGLDDPALLPLFQAIADNNLLVFLHPHYGIPINNNAESAVGTTGNEKGHALQLALGFPMETTIAVTRLVLSGIFDKIPHLKLLLAHSGGTLPFLAGRIDSCVAHDGAIANSLQHPPSWYLKKMYYDAVIYHDVGILATARFVEPTHIMFGTDHPFFPPPGDNNDDTTKPKRWVSVDSNLEALDRSGLDQQTKRGILGENACQLLNL